MAPWLWHSLDLHAKILSSSSVHLYIVSVLYYARSVLCWSWLDSADAFVSLRFNGHSRWTWVTRFQKVSILDYIGSKGEGGSGGNWMSYKQWLKWSCEAGGGSPDEARLEQTPYPFHNQLIWLYLGIK